LAIPASACAAASTASDMTEGDWLSAVRITCTGATGTAGTGRIASAVLSVTGFDRVNSLALSNGTGGTSCGMTRTRAPRCVRP
jgi:hypothetical protein